MQRHDILHLSALAVVGLALLPANSVAQQKTIKEQLVGAWTVVSDVRFASDGKKDSEPYGANPKGTFIFDNNGHFAQIFLRSDLPRITSREAATPEQDRSIARGLLASYGTYSVDEPAKVIITHYEASSFAGLDGTDGKRVILQLTADELKTRNPAGTGGLMVEATWRRAK